MVGHTLTEEKEKIVREALKDWVSYSELANRFSINPYVMKWWLLDRMKEGTVEKKKEVKGFSYKLKEKKK